MSELYGVVQLHFCALLYHIKIWGLGFPRDKASEQLKTHYYRQLLRRHEELQLVAYASTQIATRVHHESQSGVADVLQVRRV